MKVHEALSAVMADVQAVGKGGKVEIKGRPGYSFRGIDQVVNAVGPALREHGVLVMPKVLDKQYRDFQTSNGNLQHECVVEVEYRFIGPEGDDLVCSAVGEAADSGDKATPKAMSVAFRTALLIALCIPTDQPDPDEHQVERAAPEPADPVKQAWRALRVEVASRRPELGDDEQKRIAQAAWDACEKDPKRLNEMFTHIEAKGEDV